MVLLYVLLVIEFYSIVFQHHKRYMPWLGIRSLKGEEPYAEKDFLVEV